MAGGVIRRQLEMSRRVSLIQRQRTASVRMPPKMTMKIDVVTPTSVIVMPTARSSG